MMSEEVVRTAFICPTPCYRISMHLRSLIQHAWMPVVSLVTGWSDPALAVGGLAWWVPRTGVREAGQGCEMKQPPRWSGICKGTPTLFPNCSEENGVDGDEQPGW